MKNIILIFFVIFTFSTTYAQVGINADNSAPHSSAQLDVKSTTKAFYPPRMTTAQKNAISSPQAGAVVFDNTLNQLSFYNGTAWVAAAGGGLTLPYNQTASQYSSYDGGLFKVTNTYFNEGVALNGTITGADGIAIRAMATNTAAYNTTALYATNSSTNNNGMGIFGSHAGGGIGVFGSSTIGIGVNGSGGSYGVKGTATGTTGYGVYGETSGTYGAGVRGFTNTDYTAAISALATGILNSDAIYASSKNGIGVEARSINGIGLIASSTYGQALITTGGNVGIGVTDPSTILDIKSRVRIRNSAETSGVYFDGTTDSYKGFIGLETDNLTGIYGFNGAEWAVKMNNTTGEWMATKGLSVGGGTKVEKITKVTIPYDLPSIAGGNNSFGTIFTIPGVALGDQVIASVNSDMGSIIIGSAYVSAVDNVYVRFINTSVSAINYPNTNFHFTIIK